MDDEIKFHSKAMERANKMSKKYTDGFRDEMPEEIWANQRGMWEPEDTLKHAELYRLKSTVDAEWAELEKVINHLRRREELLCEIFDVPYEQEKGTFKFDTFVSRAKQMKAADSKVISDMAKALRFYADREHISSACGTIVDHPIHIDHVECGKVAKSPLDRHATRIAKAGEEKG